MGSVFDTRGALSAAPEVTYGVEVVPTDAMTVSGEVEATHDDTFPEQDLLRLSSSGIAPARQHNKIDISFTVLMGKMNDAVNGKPSWHPIMIATGHSYLGDPDVGVGNFYEYKPISSGFGSATMYDYWKEDEDAELSITKYLGTRGTITITIEGGSGPQLQFEGSAKHAFPSPFSALTQPATFGLGLTPPTMNGKCWGVTVDVGDGPEPAKLISFTLNRNNEVLANEDDLTACADGVPEIRLEAAQITGELVIEFNSAHVAATGDNNFWRRIHDNDIDCEVRVFRDDGEREFSITIPKARFTEVQQGTGDGRRQLTMPFIAQPTVADDEYTIREEVLSV